MENVFNILTKMNNNLRLFYEGIITGNDFLKLEKNNAELINELGYVVYYKHQNRMASGINEGLPESYMILEKDMKDLINSKALVYTAALDQRFDLNNDIVSYRAFMNDYNTNGFSLKLFRWYIRGIYWNSNKMVSFGNDKKGIIVGYYLGGSGNGYPLRYKIKLDNGSTTDIREEKVTILY